MVTKGKIFVKSQMVTFFFHLHDCVELKISINSTILVELNIRSWNKIKCVAQINILLYNWLLILFASQSHRWSLIQFIQFCQLCLCQLKLKKMNHLWRWLKLRCFNFVHLCHLLWANHLTSLCLSYCLC